MRERGNVWPIICVIAVALLVLGLPLVIRHRQASGRMATVDAHVSIADGRNDPNSSRDPPLYRWPDSEEDLILFPSAASSISRRRRFATRSPRSVSRSFAVK